MIYNKNTSTWIIIIVLISIIIFIYFRNTENFVTNTEAINNISSMYNSSDLTATNINATNFMSSPALYAASITGKDVNIQGDITGQNINATGTMSSPKFYGTAITGKDVNIQGIITGQNINATNSMSAVNLYGQAIGGINGTFSGGIILVSPNGGKVVLTAVDNGIGKPPVLKTNYLISG